MDEKLFYMSDQEALPPDHWQGVIHTGTRGFYSDSLVNTDLGLVIGITTLQRIVVHSLEVTIFRES